MVSFFPELLWKAENLAGRIPKFLHGTKFIIQTLHCWHSPSIPLAHLIHEGDSAAASGQADTA